MLVQAQQVAPNWVVLDDVTFVAVDTRPPSPWEQVMSLLGGALALGLVGAMVPAMTRTFSKKAG
jgi:hypothetical protein